MGGNDHKIKEVYSPNASNDSGDMNTIELKNDSIRSNQLASTSKWQSFKDSFKRADSSSVPPPKPISPRHLRLMAISTGLGTGLLVASGGKLREAGPLFLLLAYGIVGYLMVIPMVYSAGELSVAYSNLPGGFQSYFRKFIDESVAFALGWNYLIQWLSVISLELVTASMTIKYWNTSIDSDVFVAIFLVFILAVNLCGAKGYAEAEFVMNSIKLIMLTGFILYGLIIDVGGGPNGFIGGKYWIDPGPITNFKGLCSVFVASAFSFGGSEFVSLSISDQGNPRRAMSSSCKLMFVRITIFFLGSLVFVTLLVPSNSPKLMGSGSKTSASPYVIAAEMHTRVLSHFINAVILISVTSVGTSAMYSSPRLLLSLSQQGLAPKYFDYVDRQGRPLRAWILTIFVSLFSFIATYEDQSAVFTWLLSVSALSFVFVWPAICICQIRFRKALKLHGIDIKTLGYTATTGVIGSYMSITINVLILIAQFWVALFPIGGDGKPNALSFFQNYLGVVIVVVFYVGHKLWCRNWRLMIKLEDIDLFTDKTDYDYEILALERAEEAERLKTLPFYKRVIAFMS